MNHIIEWLNQRHIDVVSVIVGVAILIVAAIVVQVLSRLLRRWLAYLQRRLHLTDETNLVVARVTIAMLWIIAILVVLDTWGISLGGVWTVLVSGITVIGVGFLATWAMISNFTASFFLMLWRPFYFGQTVEMLPENLGGRVTDRNLMFTTLREENGDLLQIPNNLFFQKMFRVSDAAAASASAEHGDAAGETSGATEG